MKYDTNLKRRFCAGLIDYFIIYGIAFFLIFLLGKPDVDGTYHLNGWPALVPILFWLIFTVGFEVFLGGTLGNSIVSLKVLPVNRLQRNLTFGESLKRHLMDPIDMFLFGLVAIIVIGNTEKRQRLGDMWGKTVVVRTNQLTQKID